MLGDCCDTLRKAINEVPQSFFHTEEDGVHFLTVGYVQTADGVGWFDQALFFCPFCGAPVQSAGAVRGEKPN